MEGVMIVFKNKEVKYIYDDMYANTWQIKSFLERTVLKKEQDVIVKQEKLNISAIDYQSAIEFKGNQFLSYRVTKSVQFTIRRVFSWFSWSNAGVRAGRPYHIQ